MSIHTKEELYKKYQIIYADPPWQQAKGGKKLARPNSSGMKLDYPTLPLKDITDILYHFDKKTEDNCILFLWTTEKYLIDAQSLAERLGYKLHIRLIWSKLTGQSPAFTFRFTHEYLLFMYKGKFIPISKDMRGKFASVFIETPRMHSQKPDIAYKMIEKLYPNLSKIELFARQKTEGWDVWGNEVESDIEL